MKFMCGWISPQGEYFEVPKGTHIVWLSKHTKRPSLLDSIKTEMELYKEGWIHVGSEGQGTICTHRSSLNIRSKSYQTLIKMIKKTTWCKDIDICLVEDSKRNHYESLSIDTFLKKRF